MTLLQLLDTEIEELRWAQAYYWTKGQRDEARKCFHELKGIRRARRIAYVYLSVRAAA